MSFIISFLILIGSGFIAALIFSSISRSKLNILLTGLIFDLLILTINMIGLRYIKGIPTLTELAVYFDCMSFIWKYAVLSILVGMGLAIPYGIFTRIFLRRPQ